MTPEIVIPDDAVIHYVFGGAITLVTAVGGVAMALFKRAITKMDEDIKEKASAEFVATVNEKLDTFIQDTKESRDRVEAKIDRLIERTPRRR